ncbi:Methyltransferase domain-containing protein [Marivirga sericea]|uniref:Methyltransferase domain-containing protein n=1 Tax=Marivirga sericea TaxID=1028 RepID=A0A1X7JB75_9BACT|nr:class I SAM-dependent methyltransferase [Marivirga sericea]SMG25127.1 Methyltransferase domain-containing protein [Marivirga sericea]
MANFNRLAGFYDFLKGLVFGNELHQAITYFLSHTPLNSEVLIIGGGTGQLLANFKPTHKITYLELSEAMIIRARKVRSGAEVNFVQADILEWKSEVEFDLVITPFVLDCFKEKQLNLIYPKLKNLLKKRGKWIQTDFYPKNRVQKLLIKIMYSFFRLSAGLETKQLPDFNKLFDKHNFICTGKACFYHSMVESKIYQNIE